MTKEWTGGVPINKELEAAKQLLKRNSKIIAKSFSKHFKMSLAEDRFDVVDYYNDIIISHPKTSKFYVNLLSNHQIHFYRSIYSTAIPDEPIALLKNNPMMDKYFEKIILILSTFYATVEVVYMAQTSFSKPLGSFINKIISPDISVFQDNVKFIGVQARYKVLEQYSQNTDIRLNIANLFGGHEDKFMEKFIKHINEYAIPKDSGVSINIDDDIEDLKRSLSLAAMCLV